MGNKKKILRDGILKLFAVLITSEEHSSVYLPVFITNNILDHWLKISYGSPIMPDLMSSVPETLYKNSYWGKEIAFNHFRNQYLLKGSQRNIYKKKLLKGDELIMQKLYMVEMKFQLCITYIVFGKYYN